MTKPTLTSDYAAPDSIPDDRPEACPNCGARLSDAYCQQCGQRNERVRLNTRATLKSLFGHLLELDLAVARTFRGLCIRPGGVCLDYVHGRRRRYTNPMKYAFLVMTLMVVVLTLLGISHSKDMLEAWNLDERFGQPAPMEVDAGEELSPDEARRRDLQRRIVEAAGGAGENSRMIEVSLNYLGFIAMPCVAAVLMLFCRRRRYRFAEHYVFVLYVLGQMYLIDLVLTLVGLRNAPYMIISSLVAGGYLCWAIRGFYGSGVILSALRALLVLFVNALFTTLFAMVFITAVIIFRIAMVLLGEAQAG